MVFKDISLTTSICESYLYPIIVRKRWESNDFFWSFLICRSIGVVF